MKIKELSTDRINEFKKNGHEWYKGHKTYLDGINDEMKEVEIEIKKENTVYLEDELGDVFWDYMCLLNSLESDGLITSKEKVFERCYNKFSERIREVRKVAPNESSTWKKIKEKQNLEKIIEHKEKHG